jgi:murein L,D-transpeptidase YcbB/YkuD
LASLAAPGTSQHNSGLAVDVHTAAEPKRLNWLIENVRKFGFSWEVVPEEPWHLRYTEGDNPPAAVVEYLAKIGGEAPAQPVAKPQAPVTQINTAEYPTLTKDNRGRAVRKAQSLLEKHGIRCFQDGDFGPKTQNAVKEFQTKVGLPATGDVDTATWTALLS